MLFIELDVEAAYRKNKKSVSGHSSMYSLTELIKLSDGNLIQIAVLLLKSDTDCCTVTEI